MEKNIEVLRYILKIVDCNACAYFPDCKKEEKDICVDALNMIDLFYQQYGY